MVRLAVLFVMLPLGFGFATDGSFSGILERVGPGSISIRLADHRVIDAMLPNTPTLEAKALSAQYEIGDQVEISTKRIESVFEQATAKYQSLEVTAMRLVHRSTPEERSKLLPPAPFREGKNLLKHVEATTPIQADDLNAPGGKELAQARKVNLDYAAHMPNFLADEKAKRYRMGPNASRWSDFDTVESEITFKDNHATRRQIRRDGKAWEQPFEALPGFKWYEGFGTEISPLFDPKCPTTLEYQGRSKVSGRQAVEYKFSTIADGCFPYFYFGYQRYNPPRTGHVLVEDGAGNILRLEEKAADFPKEIELAERNEEIYWDHVKIGDANPLLPVRAKFEVRYYDRTRYRIEVEYKNHRHFEASSNVTFQ